MSSAHNSHAILSNEQNDRPATGRDTYVAGLGYLRAWGTTSPTGTGYGTGCIWQDTATGKAYGNTGNSTSPTWTELT